MVVIGGETENRKEECGVGSKCVVSKDLHTNMMLIQFER